MGLQNRATIPALGQITLQAMFSGERLFTVNPSRLENVDLFFLEDESHHVDWLNQIRDSDSLFKVEQTLLEEMVGQGLGGCSLGPVLMDSKVGTNHTLFFSPPYSRSLPMAYQLWMAS